MWYCCCHRTGHGGTDCEQCDQGTYSEGGPGAQCQRCPSGQTSSPGAVNAAECACPAGQGDTQGSTVCSVCEPGTYSTGPVTLKRVLQEGGLVVQAVATQAQACATCPARQTSPAGATSLQQCVCGEYRWCGAVLGADGLPGAFLVACEAGPRLCTG